MGFPHAAAAYGLIWDHYAPGPSGATSHWVSHFGRSTRRESVFWRRPCHTGEPDAQARQHDRMVVGRVAGRHADGHRPGAGAISRRDGAAKEVMATMKSADQFKVLMP